METENLLSAAEKVCDVAMANGVQDPELRSAIVRLFGLVALEVKVNVYVNGVKQSVKSHISRDEDLADMRLGRIVHHMPKGTNLFRDSCGKWGLTGGMTNAYLCSSPEEALTIGGVKP